jgi:hypothetical protein
MGERSIIIPPSQADCPERLWPPPRTAVRSPWAAANFTAHRTSAAPTQRTMSAGLRSKSGFQSLRAASYPDCSAVRTLSVGSFEYEFHAVARRILKKELHLRSPRNPVHLVIDPERA